MIDVQADRRDEDLRSQGEMVRGGFFDQVHLHHDRGGQVAMSVVCPKDLRYCPDDVCNGTEACLKGGGQTLLRCPGCLRPFDPTGEGDGYFCGDCEDGGQGFNDVQENPWPETCDIEEQRRAERRKGVEP